MDTIALYDSRKRVASNEQHSPIVSTMLPHSFHSIVAYASLFHLQHVWCSSTNIMSRFQERRLLFAGRCFRAKVQIGLLHSHRCPQRAHMTRAGFTYSLSRSSPSSSLSSLKLSSRPHSLSRSRLPTVRYIIDTESLL